MGMWFSTSIFGPITVIPYANHGNDLLLLRHNALMWKYEPSRNVSFSVAPIFTCGKSN